MFELINPPIRPNDDRYAKRLPPQSSWRRASNVALDAHADIRTIGGIFNAAPARPLSADTVASTVSTFKRAPAPGAPDNGTQVRNVAKAPTSSIAGTRIERARHLLAAFCRCIASLFGRRPWYDSVVFDVRRPDIRGETSVPLPEPIVPPDTEVFGGTIATPYAKYEVPPGDRMHIHDLSNAHRGLDAGYAVRKGLEHTEDARRTFFGTRGILHKDASAFLAAPLQVSKRPELSLPDNATASDVLRCAADQGVGIVVGEWHSSAESKKLLCDNMAMLAANGVSVLYLEHLLSDFHQHALDAYQAGNAPDMPAVLSEYLDAQDWGHHTDPDHGFRKLVEAAHDHGIAIVALDCMASYRLKGIYAPADLRTKMFSYFAQAVIGHHQGKADPANGHKWVALVGNTHTNTYQGIPGLAELTGAIGVRIARRKDDKDGKEVEVDPGAELRGGLGESGFVRADYVLNLPPVERSASPK